MIIQSWGDDHQESYSKSSWKSEKELFAEKMMTNQEKQWISTKVNN